MTAFEPRSEAWLSQVKEETIDPDRAIVDPHHHLWKSRFGRDYLLPELWQDTDSGHRIEKTIFMECRAFYYREGPEHLRSLGETEYVTKTALESQQDINGRAQIAALIAKVDLRLAGQSESLLRETLAQHGELSQGLLRGIRHAGAFDKHPEDLVIQSPAPEYLYGKEDFRNGVRLLGELGLTYDTWHYHHQNEDFLELARSAPGTTMVLDHFGTPLGVGRYRGSRDSIFQRWKFDIAEIAKCENVYAKLGGLAMPDNGFDFQLAERPPTSDELVEKQNKYYQHAIECFGPERCMFESNFPVDRLSLNYHTVWNAFKKMAEGYSEEEKHAMFYGTAESVYQL